jgi:predicted alpha/beta superfamily hydrolase
MSDLLSNADRDLPATEPRGHSATVPTSRPLSARRGAARSPRSSGASVKFVVHAPPDTPPDAWLFISGSTKALGRGQSSGLALRRVHDGQWHGEARLEPGRTVELRVTQGAGRAVEAQRDGSAREARRFRVRGGTHVVHVEGWRRVDPGACALERHAAFRSRFLALPRDVIVCLPPGYDPHGRARHPVLYLQDGQNLFDPAASFAGASWEVPATLARLAAAGHVEAPIVVGIHNTPDRIDEYTPTRDERIQRGGRADDYVRFLVEELKPFIDERYRTRPGRGHTALGGSSLGGLLALHAGLRHGAVFGRAAALSPSLWWDDHRLLREIAGDLAPEENPVTATGVSTGDGGADRGGERGDRHQALSPRGTRLWIDMGSAEGCGPDQRPPCAIEAARRLVAALESAGRVPGRDYYYAEVTGGAHDERAWSARFDRVLRFLFPPRRRAEAQARA